MKRSPKRPSKTALAMWIGVGLMALVLVGCGDGEGRADASTSASSTELSAKEVQSALNAAGFYCNAQSDDPSSFICTPTEQGWGIKLTQSPENPCNDAIHAAHGGSADSGWYLILLAQFPMPGGLPALPPELQDQLNNMLHLTPADWVC